jgi:uncharacterized protein
MDGKHLPGRHLIEKFGNGGFSFGGMSHRGSLLILPSGMRALSAIAIEDITTSQLPELAAEKDLIDFLLIGTGAAMKRLPKTLTDWFSTHAIHHDAMSTSAAVSTYNVLLAEERRVAAILIAVE